MNLTDITRKLELLANLKPGEEMPQELGGNNWNWGEVISGICAEALSEIQRLRAHERASEKWLAELVPYRGSLRPPTDEPKPEPWGSTYAMNTENWK
jgi:hypothetical protein